MCWTNRPCFDRIGIRGGVIFRTPKLDLCMEWTGRRIAWRKAFLMRLREIYKGKKAFVRLMMCLCWTSSLFFATIQTTGAEQVRESILSGTWYPGDAIRLRQTIADFLHRVPDHENPGRIVALISPHAGYAYSGQVAAYAYKLLEKEKIDTVVVVAPSHHHRFDGVAVYDRGGFRTPMGLVALDDAMIREITQKDTSVRFIPEAHDREHSLEIQLPFIQTVMPDAKLVPLVMGGQGMADCERLAETLSDCARGKSVLLIASSDLSHFHPAEKAGALDQQVARHVQRMDAAGLHADLAKGRCEACGGGPMVTVMLAAQKLGANTSAVLIMADSGDITGNKTSVVGYMAAALWETSGVSTGKKPFGMQLTAEEQASLRDIAHDAIAAALDGKTFHLSEKPVGRLAEPCGAFVTLKKAGELRGCIGHIVGKLPLAETVSQMAVAAAFKDPRFPPVSKAEWSNVEIEISVLSPLKLISDASEIETGRHGIYIQKGNRSGLLLPQVALEYGWDSATFLEQTCRKAGLGKNEWKSPETRVFIFSAKIF